MRKTVTMALAATFVAFAVAAAVGEEAAAPAKGKELFLSNKCNNCHTIAAQEIEKAAKASDAAKPAEAKPAEAKEAPAAPAEGAATTTKKAPDLSAVGVDLKADFIVKYLQKLETIKDKKHMKKFMGTDEELTALAAWLAEQKDAEAAAKVNGAATKEAPKEEAK